MHSHISHTYKYPISFDNYKICVHCGKEDVVPIDIYGKESKEFINQVCYFKCKSCGKEYSIKWKDVDSESLEKIPIITDEEEKKELIDFISEEAIEANSRFKVN